jgi:uncharacterized membrane protein
MYDLLLILHFFGLALGVGSSFAFLTLGIASKDLAPADRLAFTKRTFVLSRNGAIGLVLLIVSGVGFLLTRGVSEVFQWGGPPFHAKLTFVVLLCGLLGYSQVLMKRVRTGSHPDAAKRLPTIARVMLLLNVSIVICAVLAFH